MPADSRLTTSPAVTATRAAAARRGAVVKMPGLPDWQWVSKDGAPLGLIRMDDEFVSGPGWRELNVSERQ